EFHYAPWEIEYRQRGLEVMRTELAALPTVNGVPGVNPQEREDSPSILAQYPRTVSCEEVFAHYREAAPAAGWMFVRTEQNDRGDDYAGTFEGYHLSLGVGCEDPKDIPTGSARYELLLSIDFPHNVKGLPW